MAQSKTSKARKKSNKPSALLIPGEKPGALEALSKEEKTELSEYESIIRNGWHTFVEVGTALTKVRDARLYRGQYESFEAYCRERWQYGKAHAYRLIGAAEVVSDLSPIGDTQPMSESQVRPLIALPKEDRVKAWKSAIEAAGEMPLTARLVREAASPYLPKKRRKRKKEGGDGALWQKTWDSLEKISKASKGNEAALSALEELKEYLEGLHKE